MDAGMLRWLRPLTSCMTMGSLLAFHGLCFLIQKIGTLMVPTSLRKVNWVCVKCLAHRKSPYLLAQSSGEGFLEKLSAGQQALVSQAWRRAAGFR